MSNLNESVAEFEKLLSGEAPEGGEAPEKKNSVQKGAKAEAKASPAQNEEVNPEEELPAPGDEDEQDADLTEEETDEEAEDDADELSDEELDKEYKVKINGEYEVKPLRELINGYSRESDYRQKTAKLAEERKQVQQSLVQAEMRFVEKLQNVNKAIALFDPAVQVALNPEMAKKLRQEDPYAYAELMQQAEERTALFRKNQEEIMQHTNALSEKQQQEYNAVVSEQKERVLELIPEWKDEKVKKSELDAIVAFAKEKYGVTEKVLGTYLFANEIAVLRDAYLYNKAKSATVNKPAKPVQTVRSGAHQDKGSAKSAGKSKALAALKRNPNNRHAQAAAFGEFI